MTRVEALADLADVVLSLARRLQALTSQESGAIALTPLEALSMRHIARHPGITSSEFAAELSLKSSNASAALRELERKGLIHRSPDPRDGRTVRITVTAESSEHLARVRAAWARLLSTLSVDDAQLAEMTAALQTAEEALSQRQRSRS